MRYMRSSILLLISIIFVNNLAACSNSQTSSTPTTSPTIANTTENTSPPAPKIDSSAPKKPENHGNPNQGGQVIEVDAYHLELLMVKEESNIHLDFFLQTGDTHEAIPDAKVTAQVQFPDGSQKSYNLTYDASNKHYATNLPTNASGEYKIVVLSDIEGKKVNGRFNFKL
ncbi:MAG: hypothetical protein NW214_11305 [Pseudanabaenaceae cyanobacterium bins.39]|nr:hypothetical protein [Pseudanabaenaceae cyanobacterium bins.39]